MSLPFFHVTQRQKTKHRTLKPYGRQSSNTEGLQTETWRTGSYQERPGTCILHELKVNVHKSVPGNSVGKPVTGPCDPHLTVFRSSLLLEKQNSKDGKTRGSSLHKVGGPNKYVSWSSETYRFFSNFLDLKIHPMGM